MQEKTFVFNKGSHIWIYGHGFLGVPLFQRLSTQGYCIKGFIDRNAKALQKEKPYTIVDPDCLDEVSRDDIIIITFQNIQEHEKAAAELYRAGFRKLIYLYTDTKYYPQTFDSFNALVYGDKAVEFVFPETTINGDSRKAENHYHEYGNYVVFGAPVQIVFSALLEPPVAFGKDGGKGYHYPLSAILEYDALFSMLLYGKCESTYLDRYLARLTGGSRTTETFLQERTALCGRMMREFSENGLKFFWNAPSHVELDAEGKTLLLTDGHHRAAFLSSMHQNVIPVRMDKSSYDFWVNDAEIRNVRELIPNGEFKLYTPILHPAFFDVDSLTERQGNLNAKAIAKFFLHHDLPNFSVLDYNSNIAYYSRAFLRLGAKEVVAVEKRAELSALASALNRLEGSNSVQLTDRCSDRRFDIVLCMNDLAPEMERDPDAFDSSVKEMDDRCDRFFVIKLRNEKGKAARRILELTSFTTCSCLNMVVENGQRKEVLVFGKR